MCPWPIDDGEGAWERTGDMTEGTDVVDVAAEIIKAGELGRGRIGIEGLVSLFSPLLGKPTGAGLECDADRG